MTRPLAHLSDRDLLANFWFTVILEIDQLDIDPDTTEQSVIRLDQPEDAPETSTTLAIMLAEVETRLGITADPEAAGMEPVQ